MVSCVLDYPPHLDAILVLQPEEFNKEIGRDPPDFQLRRDSLAQDALAGSGLPAYEADPVSPLEDGLHGDRAEKAS